MQGWTQFYAVVAAVAATLMGLVFVAVSVNAVESVGPGRDTSRRLSEQALQNYLTTVLIALVALTPDISTRSFGFVTICMSAIAGAVTILRLLRLLLPSEDGVRRRKSIQRYGTSVLGFALLIFSAVRMSLGDGDHRTMFAASLLVLLGSATMLSWDVLLRIADRPKDP
jgi:hypothetical protein